VCDERQPVCSKIEGARADRRAPGREQLARKEVELEVRAAPRPSRPPDQAGLGPHTPGEARVPRVATFLEAMALQRTARALLPRLAGLAEAAPSSPLQLLRAVSTSAAAQHPVHIEDEVYNRCGPWPCPRHLSALPAQGRGFRSQAAQRCQPGQPGALARPRHLGGAQRGGGGRRRPLRQGERASERGRGGSQGTSSRAAQPEAPARSRCCARPPPPGRPRGHHPSQVSVWYGCVLRGDLNTIRVGAFSNIQDRTVVHAARCVRPLHSLHAAGARSPLRPGPTPQRPPPRRSSPTGLPAATQIGRNVTIGQGCLLRSATVGDDVAVGDRSILLEGSLVEKGSVLAAGTVLPPGRRVPSGQLWAGNPAKFVRDLTKDEVGGRAPQRGPSAAGQRSSGASRTAHRCAGERCAGKSRGEL
jgi:carbonic anhydrase/acetyltransferase-like protein (isoleucine patch superfamily)